MQEEKVAGASYLLTFLSDIEFLIAYASSYINLYVHLKNKYTEESLQKYDIEDSEKKSLMETINQLRSIIFKVYVRFNALTKQIKEFKTYKKEIKKYYEKIIPKDKSDSFVPLVEDVENFVIKINEIFVEAIMSELIVKSREILKGLTE